MRQPARGYDAELRRHNEVLRRAAGIRPGEHVLDIGCGAGQTTRQAARAAGSGSALGVDVSAPAIGRAREQATAEGLPNVAFEHADAQLHPFAPARFSVAISRFGTMFFGDPVAAFGNVAAALRPEGRLVMLVWQTGDRNEWDVAIRRALDADGPTAGPDPFSLADPPATTAILRAAGFTDITFTDVDEPVYYGPDVAAALDWVRGFTCTSELLRRRDPATAARAVDRLRDMLITHQTGDGVWFGSRAWLITAKNIRYGHDESR